MATTTSWSRCPRRTDCSATGAVCSETSQGKPSQPLSRSVTAMVTGPQPDPITATFSDMPAEHDGSEFTFDLSFSENFGLSYVTLRDDDALLVSGGDVRRARRKTKGSNQSWTITIEPTGAGDVGITLPETTSCSATGAICADDGRKLSHSTSATVLGPVGISVADVEVEEGAGVVLGFTVALSRAASSPLTVDYATSDGTATAGADYTSAGGTLTIGAGSSSAGIDVAVIDDEHNEGSETFTLTLSNASSGALTDATATGTITNHNAVPKALIARFGRTAAVHIVEQVEERVNAPRRPGFDGRVAGREINRDMGQDLALEFLQQLGGGYGRRQGQAGRVPPLDAPHRRVRFQRRRIDADRLPPNQTRCGQPLQNPRENCLVGLYVDPPPRARQRRVIRRPPPSTPGPGTTADSANRPPATKSPAPTTVTLEIADEQHPKIPTRTQTRTAQPVRVEGRAQLLDERVESRIRQNPVQPLEVRMPVARRKVPRLHPHRRRLARRRSLAHCHGRSVYEFDRSGIRPDPRLSPQAAMPILGSQRGGVSRRRDAGWRDGVCCRPRIGPAPSRGLKAAGVRVRWDNDVSVALRAQRKERGCTAGRRRLHRGDEPWDDFARGRGCDGTPHARE